MIISAHYKPRRAWLRRRSALGPRLRRTRPRRRPQARTRAGTARGRRPCRRPRKRPCRASGERLPGIVPLQRGAGQRRGCGGGAGGRKPGRARPRVSGFEGSQNPGSVAARRCCAPLLLLTRTPRRASGKQPSEALLPSPMGVLSRLAARTACSQPASALCRHLRGIWGWGSIHSTGNVPE